MSPTSPVTPWETASVANASFVVVLTPSQSLSGEGSGDGEGTGDGEGSGDGEGAGEGDEVVLSMLTVRELYALEPSLLVLPAASENFELATEITPSVVLFVVGVKVAV